MNIGYNSDRLITVKFDDDFRHALACHSDEIITMQRGPMVKGMHLEDWLKSTQDTFFILGRRWFQRTNRNTYHSVEIWINNEFSGRIPFAYGYGEQYIQTGLTWLQDEGYIPKDRDVWQWFRENRHRCSHAVAEVQRKKDL